MVSFTRELIEVILRHINNNPDQTMSQEDPSPLIFEGNTMFSNLYEAGAQLNCFAIVCLSI